MRRYEVTVVLLSGFAHVIPVQASTRDAAIVRAKQQVRTTAENPIHQVLVSER